MRYRYFAYECLQIALISSFGIVLASLFELPILAYLTKIQASFCDDGLDSPPGLLLVV